MLMKARLTKLFTLLTILTLGITNVWAAEETLTWAYSGINTACTDPSGITMSSSNATSTIKSSMAASFSAIKTKSDASKTGYSSRLQSTEGTYLGDKANKTIDANQYVGASFTIPSGYVFKLKSISFPYCGVSTSISARLTISDGETSVTPSDATASSGGTATISYNDNVMTKELSGDVTVKIWFWMPSSTSAGKYAGMGDLAITGDLVASGGDPVCPSGLTISSKNDKTAFLEGDAIELTAALTAGNGAITYQWYKGGTAEANKLTGKTAAKLEIASCVEGDAGDYYCVASKSDCSDAVNADAFTITVAHNPCATYFWFFSDADQTANGKTNATSVFSSMVSGSSNQSGSIEIDGTTYNITRRSGDADPLGQFSIPANKAGTFYALAASSGSARKIVLTNTATSATYKYDVPSSTYERVEIGNLPPGTYTIGKEGGNTRLGMVALKVCDATFRTITLEYADGTTPDGSLSVLDGTAATKPADPTWEHHRFAGWYAGSDLYDWSTTVSGDFTLTAHWTQLYTITFAAGEGSGDAPAAVADKAQGETFTVPANTFTAPAGSVFDNWSDGVNTYDPEDTYTVGTANVVLTANWRVLSTLYAITEGTHANGSITISPASQEAGETVTLTATPDEDYLFGAWEVVKTEDGTDAGVTVTNGEFTMPGYPVTVNATFVADTRKKVLYVTNTAEATVKENDKLYDALKDIYNVSIVGFNSDADQTNYDLVVLHESVGGGNYGATAVAAAKTGSTPVLNTKSYFYNDGRWNWGTPNAGKSVKGCTPNAAYCNIANHPIFAGVIDGGFVEITDAAAEKCMQPIGAFTAGKEGYTLATTPNADSGDGCAIHELTPAQRGAASGKYLMISVSNAKLDALNANGQKLFQNAAAYLIDGSASWTPVAVPTNPEVEATPSENYTEGNTITLTASAEGISASTVYTWYKGVDWATASVTTPVQAASTSGATFTKTAEVEDAGTYWCNISNGTGCDVQASVTITVSSASTPTHSITYDNVKGADMSAYPTEYTEGVGVASFTSLADITGWHFVEWSPASIASDATTDQTITAVWAQIFEVTFNLNGHGEAIAKQDIISGEKATEPTAPSAIGYDFGGWFTDAACTAGNEFDFNTAITEAKELFAKWTEFDGCVLLVPATSGDALTVGAMVDLQAGSVGGSIKVANLGAEGSISYNANGLLLSNGGKDSILVTLNNELKNGSVIKVRLMANGGTKDNGRGLNLLNAARVKKALLGWQANEEVTIGDVDEFTYTVVESDGFAGTNVFTLQRQNSVFLQSIKVENCGAAITYHDLTSEVNIAGKGTVTLGASSVREGYTTTATYSEIDPLYEFVNWTVSGAGATIENATANPATITMGTEDAVVTLNLRLIPVKFTVNYYDGTTLMGSEQVAVNEHPTASEIETAKRGYVFEGWAETDGASASDVVALNTITSDVAATIDLYAVYTAVPCPTSGTIFLLNMNKTVSTAVDVRNSSIDLDEYATISGGSATLANTSNNTRAQVTTTPSIRLSNGGEGYVQVELDCPVLEGDIIRYVNTSSGTIGVRAAHGNATNETVLQGSKTEITTVEVNAALDGLYTIYLDRKGNTSDLTYFEINRRPVATGVTLSDLTVRVGATKTPEMTLAPSADARVNSQAWTITSGNTYITIDAATGEITGVAEGDATVKVVLNDDPSISATATVHVVGSIAQQDVTKSTIWDWKNTGATANIQLTGSTDPKKNEQFVLANVNVDNDEDFESDKLVVEGEHMVRDYDKANPYFQGQLIKFNTTVAGAIQVTFSHTGNDKPARELYINGAGTGVSRTSATHEASGFFEVPAGEVSITAYHVNPANGAGQQYIRISKIEFYALGHSRSVTAGNLGTLCLPNNFIARGVDVYSLVGKEAEHGKIVFADLEPDELLVAGQAYIFQANDATAKFYYAPGDPVDAPLNNTALKGNLGSTITFQPNSPEAENVYFVKDHALWSAKETGVNIGQYRAYLQMDAVSELANPSPAPGRRYIMLGTNGTNVATGIDDVQDDVRSTKMLIDGRLFILRGEKIYDATGRLVK